MELVTKYTITWPDVEGRFELTYLISGHLKSVEFVGTGFKEVQMKWLLRNVPIWMITDEVTEFAKLSKGKCIKTPYELTFELFYAEYGVKEAKKPAQRAWNKLSAEDQLQAYLGIKHYKDRVNQRGVAPCYPATYLNQTRWVI